MTQMLNTKPDQDALVEARRALSALHLAVPAEVADDVARRVEAAFDAVYMDGYIAADNGLDPAFRRSTFDVIRPEDDPDQLVLPLFDCD